MSKVENTTPWPFGDMMQCVGRGIRKGELNTLMSVEKERGITIRKSSGAEAGFIICDEVDLPEHDHDLIRRVVDRTGIHPYNVVHGGRQMGKSNIIRKLWLFELRVQEKAEELLEEALEIESKLFWGKSKLSGGGFIDIAKDHLANESIYEQALSDAKAWVQSVVDTTPSEELLGFLNEKPSDLISYHNTLGRDVRNVVLWPHEHRQEDSCYIGGVHVDEISMTAIVQCHAENRDKCDGENESNTEASARWHRENGDLC
ncbi:hypothetical protein MYOV003v1_p0180 [Vibrio phage 207E48.1]|nr:hypothetical protein MYOV003v1_p0180 [Vibrio phage 207E48.1]